MKECAGAVGTLADKRSEVLRMDETLKLRWLCCPRCGGKVPFRCAASCQWTGILEAGTACLPAVLCQTIEGKRNYKKRF